MNDQPLEHPERSVLVAFGLGKLPPADVAAVESHIADCLECCETLQSLEADTFIDLVRRADVLGFDPAAGGEQAIDHTAAFPGNAAELVPDLPPELANHPRYRILRQLGRGGMGVVFAAEHRLMNRQVALKVIRPSLIKRPEAVARFRREVETAAKLAHSNIVTAYDAEQADELHFLVMEYVEGTPLSQIVERDGPLQVGVACNYVRQMADALEHAHRSAMVHRDIKPQNVMVTPNGQIKILDFGLATLVETSPIAAGDRAAKTDGNFAAEFALPDPTADSRKPPARLTEIGTVMGTPDFVAPEQVANPSSADIRADIYSLGCTLYYLLAGQPPFPEGTAQEKLRAHAKQSPRSLSTLNRAVTPELDNVVKRMMAKDVTDRYQTPAEVAEAIRPFASTPTTQPGENRSALRRLVLIALGAATLFCAIAAAIIYVKTDEGTLEIQTSEPEVQLVLSQGGEQVKVIDVRSGSSIERLKSGQYNIDLRSGGDLKLTMSSKSRGGKDAPGSLDLRDGFTLSRGEHLLVQVERKSAAPPTAAAQSPPLRTGRPAPSEVQLTGINLIHDPSLEDTPVGELPRGWSAWLEQGPGFKCETVEGGVTGKHCLRISGKGTRGVVFCGTLPLDRTKRYALKGRVKYEGDAGGRAILKINYFHAGKWLGVNDMVGVSANQSGWQLLEKTDVADTIPEATMIVPTCHIEGNGTAWFDDLELVAYDRNDLPAGFEAKRGKNNRPVKPLELDRWVGRWETTTSHKPTTATEGRSVKGTSIVRKILDDQFLLWDWTSETGDVQYLTILGFDENVGDYHLWLFASGGETYERTGRWDTASQTLTLQLKPPSPGVTGTSTDRFVDKDRIESTLLVKGADGQITRDLQATWLRKSSTAPADIGTSTGPAADPKELVQLEKMAGNWTIRQTNKPSIWFPNGDTATLHEQAAWTLGGRFLIIHSYDEKTNLTSLALITYEPAEMSFRYWLFAKDVYGGQWRITWDDASRSFRWRATDMPAGWIGTGINRWVNDDTFDSQALIKDDQGRMLLDMHQEETRNK